MIPPGYKLMPIEPSAAMLKAGWLVEPGEDALARRRYRDVLSAADSDATHRAHCNQGDYLGSCKYGEEDCPALTSSVDTAQSTD